MKRSKSQRRKEKQLRKILKSKKGLEKLGAAMAAPIMKQLNYTGIFRRAVVVDPIPEGALPVFYTEEEKELMEQERIANKSW